MQEAALYADRLSVNIEIPTESGLKLLALKKQTGYDQPDAIYPKGIIQYKDEKKILKKFPSLRLPDNLHR